MRNEVTEEFPLVWWARVAQSRMVWTDVLLSLVLLPLLPSVAVFEGWGVFVRHPRWNIIVVYLILTILSHIGSAGMTLIDLWNAYFSAELSNPSQFSVFPGIGAWLPLAGLLVALLGWDLSGTESGGLRACHRKIRFALVNLKGWVVATAGLIFHLYPSSLFTTYCGSTSISARSNKPPSDRPFRALPG
jgi:hypothetical protein